DVGFDGLNDVDETRFFADYLTRAAQVVNPQALTAIQDDPSADNYVFFRGEQYDNEQRNILERYKYFKNPQGNSATPQQSNVPYPTAESNLPNVEDINRDNTLSTNESYYQYRVSLRPQEMVVGQNHITDKVLGQGMTADGETIDVHWYQFKIPIRNPDAVIGGIQDFTSIRFMRIYLRGFSDSIICRFARLDLIRGEWRKYLFDLRSPGEYLADDGSGSTLFDIGAVNIEENGTKVPVNYVVPPGIDRVIDVANPQLRRLNEQALVLKVCDLEDGDARAAYRNTNFDVRSYKNLRMFVHAEALNDQILNDGDVSVFIRLGRDYNENYYEYEIPLKVTLPGRYQGAQDHPDLRKVWPLENDININFESFTNLKLERNLENAPVNQRYEKKDGNVNLAIVGNPQLSDVTAIVIGVRNPKKQGIDDPDDGLAKCAEIWVNELRLTDFDKNNGWATTGRLAAKLADFGDITLAGNMSTPGFGSIEKKISERQRETIRSYDLSGNFRMGKLLPENWNLNIPMFLGISEGFIDPQFHPNDPDLLFRDVINSYEAEGRGDTAAVIRSMVQDYTKRRSINFANVRKEKGKGATKSHFYDIENFALTLSYNETYMRNINTEYNVTHLYRGAIAYAFNTTPTNYKPFSKIQAINKNKYLKLISDFNFSLMPSRISVITNVDRLFNAIQIRNTFPSADYKIPETFNKNFVMMRNYELRHDISKSLKFDYTANNTARILEPYGRIDTDEKRDSLKQSIYTLGTNTLFSQAANINYTLPLNKFPLTDWITVSARLGSTYDWMRAPFATDSIGNTIKNSWSEQVNGQLNFVSLYNKVPYLKKVNQKVQKKGAQRAGAAKPPPPRPTTTPTDTTKKKEKEGFTIFEQTARLIMTVKNASLTYTENQGTILPGYNDSPYLLGMNRDFSNPGLGFVFGQQDPNFARTAADRGMLEQVSVQNVPYSTTRSTNFNGRANLEPIRDLRVELNMTRNFAQSNSEFFRWNDSIQDF
ncbi:MAG: cell surface protein SprA, partial [Bacteroidetes bacterium]|nr:cell surface protein SprA [Bacteroidota bacterium]